MPRFAFFLRLSALGVLASISGCNAVLGIEEHAIVEQADSGVCGDSGGCGTICGSGMPCRNGLRCESNRCVPSPDAGPHPGGMDAGPEAGSDAQVECGIDDPRPECGCEAGYHWVDGQCARFEDCSDHNGGCSPDATCTELPDSVQCTCPGGWTDTHGDGTECIDPCTTANCPSEFSTCSIVDGNPTCACLPSYVFDETANTCTFDEECALLACDQFASCRVVGADRSCECNPGYEGDGTDCTNPDDCLPDNPCQNNGTCADGLDAYSCSCVVGFNGDECENNIDDCAPVPCLNGGDCTDGLNTYSCDCQDGYTGPRCQTNVDDCDPNPCLNGGSCVDGVDEYSCNCVNGYIGDNCEMGTCASTTPLCLDLDQLQTCSAGITSITHCSATDETCVNDIVGSVATGDCIGECPADTYQCVSSTESQRCDSSGDWIANGTCTTSPPQRCDQDMSSETYGTCIDNAPFDVGGTLAGGSVYALFNDQILAQPVDITENLTLIAFGMRTDAASVGGNAYLSLHVDNNGQPGNIVNRTGSFGIASGSVNRNGRASGAPANVALTAGNRYWIVAKISEGGGSDVRIFASDATPAGNFRSGIQTYGVPTNLAPGATGANTGSVSLFIEVQR